MTFYEDFFDSKQAFFLYKWGFYMMFSNMLQPIFPEGFVSLLQS